MFDFVRNNTRILFFVLVLLIIPSFVLWGVDGYRQFNDGATSEVAHVDGRKITQAEWDAAHRQQIERIRAQMPNVDAKLFDTPAMKQQTLDALMRERVLLAAAEKLHLVTSDERLRRIFTTDPQFEFMRNPDGSVNAAVLAAQGMNSQMLEQRLRQELSTRQVLQGVGESVTAPAAVVDAAMNALFQQREVLVQRFAPKDQLAKVNPTDADLEKYHADPAHAEQFRSPEQASIEYLVLDIEGLKKSVVVNEEELRKYYSENLARYSTPEERRASHILVKTEKGAPAAEREKAKAKAESLLAELKKNPQAFAELARKNSDDSGSAASGGDLDFFGRGAMVKPFEDSAFALKPGETSGLVETDFGYHIIRVTAARGGDKKPYDAVRAEIEDSFRTQAAQKRYAEVAAEFGNLVYEQSDSLKPAAEKFKLEIRKADGVARTPATGAAGPLASPKFLDALFGNDALRNKRNTEAIETAPSQLVAGRVLQYSPARQLPLAEVRDRVLERVRNEQAAALARKEGEARLAALSSGNGDFPGTPVTVSRAQPGGLPRELLDAALAAPTTKLPYFAGVDLGTQGYAIVRVDKVIGRDPATADPARAAAAYARAWGEAESLAYFDALKQRYKAEVVAPAASASAPAR
jgi:peptidyl-prolyl cis-trans isomerase D